VKYLDLKEGQFVEREQESLNQDLKSNGRNLEKERRCFIQNEDFVEKLNVLDSLEEQLEEREKVLVSKEKFKLQVMHLSETKSV
jgi:hypothetical protein